MANDVAARIHIKFVMSGDDIIKQINAITSAIKDSGVSARAIADIFSAASKRAAEEAKAAAAVKTQEIRKEMSLASAKAREAESAAQVETAASRETAAASAEAAAQKIKDAAAVRAAATQARTEEMKAAREGRKKGVSAPGGVPDAQSLSRVQAIRAALVAMGANGAANIKTIVSWFAKLAGTAGGIALKAVKNIAKAIISIPLAPLKMLKNAFGDVGRIIAGMIGFQGLKSLGRNISDLTKQAGPIEALRVQFENFMQQARYNTEGFTASSRELITEMQRMTGGALDITTMLKGANMAFALIGDQVGKDLPKLMGIAQAAALATGQDVGYVVESLTKGIGRLSTRWIDNAGISINATEEYAKYGQEVGKAANTLTQAERVQALLNATMREGEKILLKTGNLTVFLQTQMAQFGANLRNIRDGAMAAFAPFATVALMYINKFTSEATPKVEDWSEGFVRQFASIPPKIAPAMQAMVQAGTLTGQAAQYAADGMESAQMTMGRSASDWAVNALTWGANVGSQFAIGIMNGFGMFISTAMNFISSVLTNWLSPGSPPKVAPYIDKWGEAAMGEWVKGMMNYPIHNAFPQIKEDLRALLDQDVKDNLFQWGVDSIAEWAKGLSTIDLEFLSQSIEFAFNKAKRLNEELTRSYKSQKSELFKLQVLNRDPAAIKAQIKKVTTTKRSLDANEIQLRQLEMQKELIQEQLELFRLLAKAIQDSSSKSAKGKTPTGGGESPIEDMMDSMIQMPLAGTSLLEEKIAGIKERLKEIFEDPLKNMKDSFTENAALIGASFTTLKDTIAEVMPVAREKFDNFIKKMTEFGEEIKSEFKPDLLEFKKSLVDSYGEIEKAIDLFKTAAGESDATKGIFFTILHVILAVINGIFLGFGQLIAGIIQIGAGIKQVLAGDIGGGIITILRGIMQGIFSTIGMIFVGMAEVISKLFGTTWGEVKAVWANNWEMLKKIVAGVGLNILESILDMFEGVRIAFEQSELGKLIEHIFPDVDLSSVGEEGRALGREFISKAREELFDGQPEIAASSQTLINAAIAGVSNNTAGISQSVQGVVNSMLPDTAMMNTSFVQGWTDVGASLPRAITDGAETGTDALNEALQYLLPAGQMQEFGTSIMDDMSLGVNTGLPILQGTILAAGLTTQESITTGFAPVEQEIEAQTTNWLTPINDFFDNIFPDNFQKAWDRGWAGVPKIIDKTGRDISKEIGRFTKMFEKIDLGKAANLIGRSISEGLGLGVTENSVIAEEAATGVGEATLRAARDSVGAQSPAKRFIELGEDIVSGLANGIRNNTARAVTEMSNLMVAVINAISGAGGGANAAASAVMQNMADAMLAIAQSSNTFYAVGLAITYGIQNGMSESLPAFKKYAWGYAKSIETVLRNAWGIMSPSKVFAEIGEYAVQGLSLGLSKMNNIPIGAMAAGLGNKAAMGLGQLHTARSQQPVVVEVNAPIVGTMMVPNMVVGREMSRQISRDISDMATLQRMPA